jgi:hypothetical protein
MNIGHQKCMGPLALRLAKGRVVQVLLEPDAARHGSTTLYSKNPAPESACRHFFAHYFRFRDRPAVLCVGNLNHAEEVVFRIFQHDKVIVRFIPPGVPSRAELDQPLHLALLVVCIEVEVQTTSLA